MASGFERAHSELLRGSLTTVDRLIIHGHLRQLWFEGHMAYFLNRLGVHIVRDFGQFMSRPAQKVIAHAEALAKKAGRPFVYQDRVVHGKDSHRTLKPGQAGTVEMRPPRVRGGEYR